MTAQRWTIDLPTSQLPERVDIAGVMFLRGVAEVETARGVELDEALTQLDVRDAFAVEQIEQRSSDYVARERSVQHARDTGHPQTPWASLGGDLVKYLRDPLVERAPYAAARDCVPDRYGCRYSSPHPCAALSPHNFPMDENGQQPRSQWALCRDEWRGAYG